MIKCIRKIKKYALIQNLKELNQKVNEQRQIASSESVTPARTIGQGIVVTWSSSTKFLVTQHG